MKRHKRHRSVESDLRAAALWYERREPGLGEELVEAVDAAIGKILQNPSAWSRLAAASPGLDLRRFVLHRFPFYVAYLIDESGEVFVLAVAHARRRPGFWLRRARPARGRKGRLGR